MDEKQRTTAGPLPSQCGILPHHVDHLAASGITPQQAAKNGIYSETDSTRIASLLGWKSASKLGPCIVFPVRDASGQTLYHRIRPDSPRPGEKGKPVKYESPRGRKPEPYFPDGIGERLQDTTAPLLITEGEKKSIAATEAGFYTIALQGVHCWKVKNNQRLIPALERIKWKGRRVYLCFDSDISIKPGVAAAESQLAVVLESLGADVKCVRLPDGPDDVKWGVDDYLLANSPAEFAKLLESATEPEPPEEGSFKPSLKDCLPEEVAALFVDSTRRDGILTLRFWAGSFWKWAGGRYQELSSADIRAELVRFLSANYFDIKTGAVNDVMMHVSSLCCVLSSTQPPRWLDGGDEVARTWAVEDLFATKTHVINLHRLCTRQPGAVVAASPGYFSMVAADYEYQQDAPQPERWLKFLDQVWPDDPESIRLLQQWMGYCLTPDTRQQKALWLIGPKRSGKGTILRQTRALVGEGNCTAPTLSSLAGEFGLSPLLGKTIALVGDARLSRRSDLATITERLLSITGEDAQSVNRKHRDAITTKLQARFMVCSNELPRLDDSSGALAGRLLMLRMTESFFGREDHGLDRDLAAEREAILLWAIGGWWDLRQCGRFIQPKSCEDLIEQVSDLTSPVGQFVRERCELGPGLSVPLVELHHAFKSWAEHNGQDRVPIANHFSRDLSAAFPKIHRSRQRTEGGSESRETTLVGIDLRY